MVRAFLKVYDKWASKSVIHLAFLVQEPQKAGKHLQSSAKRRGSPNAV